MYFSPLPEMGSVVTDCVQDSRVLGAAMKTAGFHTVFHTAFDVLQ